MPGTSTPYYDYLTRDMYMKLRELAADPTVAACWSVGRGLKSKLAGDTNTIISVKSVFATNT
jgi:hypothetical protein